MSRDGEMLSALFVSVSGSSRLFEKLGGTEALHAIERCMKRILRGVDGFRGRIVRTTRDDLAALFDNADDACQAAIAMQRRVADLPPVSGIKLAIRAGFHHGQVVGEGVGSCVNAAECLAGMAGPGQILTTAETQALLSPLWRSSTRCLEGLSIKGQTTDQRVFEVSWPKSGSQGAKEAVASPPLPRSEREVRLCVRYAGHVKLLDRLRPKLLLGRDSGCDLTVRDRRASRHHAQIERRGETFVLRDLSTNGTFVTVTGGPELLVRREEIVLRDSGIIAFAASASSPGADLAEFEVL
ncbi:adenylate/guanylate cyclase domain-containing protein [Accumulibacter sp.]|uniref:adenylate/guanylate cyclase domain-containing protein n=1 Tax=Accumulibacter sp. TaxID=2053492 RepID=UPI002630E90F|nr:adenylate/guanylate cyclase domain-containing protein [Accumulibacter sp.]